MRKRLFLFLLLLPSFFLNAHLVPYLKGKEWHLYNKSTRTVLPEVYESIVATNGNLLLVKKDNLWGAVDGTQKFVIPIAYPELKQLNSSVLSARDKKGIHLLDTNGRAISKIRFQEASAYQQDPSLIVARNSKGKYGIINSHGKVRLKFQYDLAPEHLGSYLIVGNKSAIGEKQVGLVDSVFEEILPVRYSKISLLEKQYIVGHLLKGDYTLMNQNRSELYRGEGEPIKMYNHFILLRKNDEFGVYARDVKKSFLYKGQFYYHVWDEQGLAVFNDHYASVTYFISSNGETNTVDGYTVYTNETFSKYFAVSFPDLQEKGGKKFGMIDRTGKFILPMQYDNIASWNDTYCSAGTSMQSEKRRTTNYSLIEIATGKDALGRTCEDIQLFPLGGIALKENGVYHLYDVNLKPQDNRDYISVSPRGGDLLFRDRPNATLYPVKLKMTTNVAVDYSRGYVDGNCNIVLEPIYRNVVEVKDNYNEAVQFHRLVGDIYDSTFPYPVYYRSVLLDEHGKRLTAREYSGVVPHASHNLITVLQTVQYEDEWRSFEGLMDTMGRIVIPPAYDEITDVREENFFQLRLNGKSTFADLSGKVMTPLEYGYVQAGPGNALISIKNGKAGILSKSGEILLPFLYDQINPEIFQHQTLYKVTRDKIEFYVDRDGTEYYTP